MCCDNRFRLLHRVIVSEVYTAILDDNLGAPSTTFNLVDAAHTAPRMFVDDSVLHVL